MEDRIEIGVYGTKEAIEALRLRYGSVKRGVRIGMTKTTLSMRGITKRILATGEHDAPRSRRGAAGLSGSIINIVTEEGDVIIGIVGSTLPYKTGYAAILEKGGQLPEILPKKGKYLRFPRATGMAGIAHQAALQSGSTYKQAMAAAVRVHRRMSGARGKALDRLAFVYVKKVPARYQRAMPYLRPGLTEEQPRMSLTFRAEIKRELARGRSGSGPGES